MIDIESFHPETADVYLAVHKWLSDRHDTPDYCNKGIRNKIDKLLEEKSLLSAAAQYYILFPAHFFKVGYTLRKVIGAETLENWLNHNSRICLVDVGCGAGAASAAFVDSVLKMKSQSAISRSVELYCIGIDINPSAIALYNQFMSQLKPRANQYGIQLNYNLIPRGDLPGLSRLRDFLEQKRVQWDQPYLSQVLIMQSNVLSPFSQRYGAVTNEYNELRQLGVDIDLLGNYHKVFGREEATAYRQLLEGVAIDHLYVFTIGTKDWEIRVQEMSQAIDSEFNTGKHTVERIGSGHHRVDYLLPKGCYWSDWVTNETYQSDFDVDVSAITNAELEDPDWVAVKRIDNLKLAWARARHHALEEALADEVEVRLFESNLDENLTQLQQQLVAYASDLAQFDDRVAYSFPKDVAKSRPRGLSRLEEEILSTALIQRLGPKVENLMTYRSYAYRFTKEHGESNTEHLYDYWFFAHSRFMEDARLEARKHDHGRVIRADIKSFFTRIIREQLRDIAAERLTKSQRVEWLIRLLLSKDIDGHEAGLGIVQGNISSGFFANLYLLSLDSRFAANNEWNAEFFRFVDDMIVVLPEQKYVSEVLTVIRAELNELHLELNEKKTEIVSMAKFLEETTPDEQLNDLQKRHDVLVNLLWIMDADNRGTFRRYYYGVNDEWWYQMDVYRQCIEMLGL